MRKRGWLGAALGAVAMGAGCATVASAASDQAVQQLGRINHIVVIYQENHSFDNLYGHWEGVNGLSLADPAHTTQVNQAGAPYSCLKQVDVNLASPPLPATCTDATTGTAFSSAFPNAPFTIDTHIPAPAATCPAPGVFAPNGVRNGEGLPGGCTRDLVHRYYQEIYQLNGGRQNRYVTGSDAIGLTMGTYDTTLLPVYRYLHEPGHPAYGIADDFFQSALGGSYLNHQWLISARTPTWTDAPNDGGADDLHSVLDANGMPTTYPLYTSPSSAVRDTQLTQSCSPPAGRGPLQPGYACGDFSVNTTQPPYQPYAPGTPPARRLPPQTTPTIGDRLSGKGIDWAWYSGGWSNANGDVGGPGWTNGTGPACSDPNTIAGATYPNCPAKLFQFHHQPLNYYASFAPGTAARAQHLRDEAEFLSLAHGSTTGCGLKPVSIIKPVGDENEHPGYASEPDGSDHLVDLLKAVVGSSCAADTMVIVTYDEFGGQWDHVSPPGQGGTPGPHDIWGPGTRIPALVVAPGLRRDYVVDHTQYDTTSIMATIEKRFGVAPVNTRDAAVNDLANVFDARNPFAESVPGDVTGTVPPTLSLSIAGPVSFGPFTPGVEKTYLATTPATVTSTAGDALLSVADPSPDHTGHLVNGTSALPEPLKARATRADTTGTAPNDVGSSTSPLNLLTWNAPVSNDAVMVEFSQWIKRTDPLRTGTYAKTLTFTLSTTMP